MYIIEVHVHVLCQEYIHTQLHILVKVVVHQKTVYVMILKNFVLLFLWNYKLE